MYYKPISPFLQFRKVSDLEKRRQNTLFHRKYVKILRNNFLFTSSFFSSSKKESRKLSLRQISDSNYFGHENFNAKFYIQVLEASPHYSKRNSPLLSTLRHSNESHQQFASPLLHYILSWQSYTLSLAKMISIPTD